MAHRQVSKKVMSFIVTVDLGKQNAPAIHVLNIVRQMALRGYDITVIVPRFRGKLPVELPPKGIKIIQTPNIGHWGLPNSLNALLQLPYLFFLKRGPLYIRSSPLSFPAVALVKLLRRRPIVLEYNGWFFDELISLGVPPALAAFFNISQAAEARMATKIRVVTKGLQDILENRNIAGDKITVIENGADTEVFIPVSKQHALEQLKLPEEKRYIAFIGNLWPPVDLKSVFQALKRVTQQQDNIIMLVVGDGREAENFRQLAQKYEVGNHVRFLGALEQKKLKYVMGVSEFGISPLHSDRNKRIGVSPLKIYEYASCGKPVIATDLLAISQKTDKSWLALVPPGSVSGWAEQISKMLTREDLDTLGLQARSCAVAEFGWQRRAAQIEQLLS